MKSSPFSLERPSSMQQALATKARWGSAAQFLAGGQNLMPAMAMRFSQSECLINLNGLEDLRQIRRINRNVEEACEQLRHHISENMRIVMDCMLNMDHVKRRHK
jgi:hypothetical protein